MARPGFPAVKSTPADRFLLILSVWGQKVKGIGPSPLVILIESREQEPARSADRTAITTSLGHDLHDCRSFKACVWVILGLKRMASATKVSIPS